MSPPNPDKVEADRLAVELRVAEYTTVRGEWLTSRDAQQHTLQWTLAALAVLLAGILNSHARTAQPFIYVALAGTAVALAICSQGIWFGEVMRMERAALYLRGLETALRSVPRAEGTLPPLMWETWRGVPRVGKSTSNSPWVSKASISIVASMALYGLLSVAALIVLFTASGDTHVPTGDRHFAVIVASIGTAVYLLATVYMCVEAVKIRRVSSLNANFAPFVANAQGFDSVFASDPDCQGLD